MEYVKPSYRVMSPIFFDRLLMLRIIEKAGRTCYKSESRWTEETGSDFLKKIVSRGHLSVIEHISITVCFVCNRGVSHELVRHRLASYSQESTRYCDYVKGRRGINMIDVKSGAYKRNEVREVVTSAMREAEKHYFKLRGLGLSPQMARNVLPINLKTEIVVSANLREWLHIFKMRCATGAHPQIRELMLPLLKEFKEVLPEIYGGLNYE